MKPETFQTTTLIMGIIMILFIIGVALFIFYNIQLIKSNPCQLCMDQGFSCFKWDTSNLP